MHVVSKLKIGDKLYRHVVMSGVWEYVVIGLREYKDSTLYEVESQACTHGYKCVLLVAENEKGQFKYVSLVNYDADDDQSYWHNDKQYNTFWRNKGLAHKECYETLLRESKDKIVTVKKQLAYLEEHDAKLTEALTTAIAMIDDKAIEGCKV